MSTATAFGALVRDLDALPMAVLSIPILVRAEALEQGTNEGGDEEGDDKDDDHGAEFDHQIGQNLEELFAQEGEEENTDVGCAEKRRKEPLGQSNGNG